ncbi:MAG TPA: hypothetical protein VHB21_12215 [Minicystis sp.]|nr:hypothetical protein [Minicystis sp.]
MAFLADRTEAGMIANALRGDVERYAELVRRDNPLFVRAAAGSLDRASIAKYLANIRYLIRHTQHHFIVASDEAALRGYPELAVYYRHKQREEAGHDEWARRDLQRVANRDAGWADDNIVPAMHELMRLHVDWIRRDPRLFLSYMLFGEYLIALIGPAWLKLLAERCGIPASSMTVVGNHTELDPGHVEEWSECVDRIVTEPHMLQPMRDVLLETFASFERFCAEVVEASHEDERGEGGDEHRVSAA